jgi:DNA-binding transcriptional regulator YiaG
MRPVKMTPEEMKRLRREAGLTQVQLADALGVAPRTVQAWEGGTNKVPSTAAMAVRLVVKKDSSLPSSRKTNRTR